MKSTLKLLLCGVLLFPVGLNAQNKKQKVKVHKVWVTLVDGSKIKGNLFSANELGIKITDINTTDISNVATIDAEKIKILKIRIKGKLGKSALVGGLTGAGLSVLIGASVGSEEMFTPGETMLLSSILLVPLGSGIGALVGSKKEKIFVDGDIKNYEQQLKLIQSYSLMLLPI